VLQSAYLSIKIICSLLQSNVSFSLKGWSHQIGKACICFHWIDLKFKGNRYMFLFNLNVVFTTNFLKMAPIRVRFSPGFPPGAEFHGEECSRVLLAPRREDIFTGGK
jgi:hypothetical protein